jgi:hypothetical protein
MTNPIDRLLRETLNSHAADNPPTPCPDAEVAAAFADDTLTRHERLRVEAHVADCGRCQMWIAALEKTRPPVAPRAWWRRRAIAWLVPIAAAATALIVWINVTRGTDVGRSPVSSQTARNETPALDSSKGRRDQSGSAEAVRSRSAAAPSAPTSATDAAAAEQKRQESIASRESRQSASARALAAGAIAPPVPPPRQSDAVAPPPPDAPLASRPLPQIAAAQPTAARAPAASSRNATGAAATPAPIAETLATEAARAERPLVREELRAPETIINSSDQDRRWRIAVTGVVQHSADGGATWHTQSTGVNVRLTAGSSPSRAVCWLVGPGGTVVLTINEGRTWQRLAFPEPVDLVAVSATDSDTARIVTADGRTFGTSDRGQTWKR